MGPSLPSAAESKVQMKAWPILSNQTQLLTMLARSLGGVPLSSHATLSVEVPKMLLPSTCGASTDPCNQGDNAKVISTWRDGGFFVLLVFLFFERW